MMSNKGDMIAQAANAMVGVPFKHQGRNPKAGVDCAGLVLCAVWSAGCELPDCIGYGPQPKADVLLAELQQRARCIHLDDAEPGDILLFEYRKDMPMHFAVLLANNYIVHAHGQTGRVIRQRLTSARSERLHSIWRVEGAHG